MRAIVNTFVLVAADCPAQTAVAPQAGAPISLARAQFELLTAQPYRFDNDELNFAVHILRAGLTLREVASNERALREEFFAAPRDDMRASPLTRRLGWGAHYDSAGRIALHGVDSAEYARLANPWSGLRLVRAMDAPRPST